MLARCARGLAYTAEPRFSRRKGPLPNPSIDNDLRDLGRFNDHRNRPGAMHICIDMHVFDAYMHACKYSIDNALKSSMKMEIGPGMARILLADRILGGPF